MAVSMGYDGRIPYMYFNGSSKYIPPDTTGVVRGTESWVNSTQRGLTIGCWVKPSIVNQDGTHAVVAREGSYLFYESIGYMTGLVWASGGLEGNVTLPVSANIWQHFVFSWQPQIGTSMWKNGGNKTTYSWPSSTFIVDAQQPLYFGHRSTDIPWYYIGHMAYPFICASALSDDQVENIYNVSKNLFL